MKSNGDAKPPSTRPASGRAQPIRVRSEGAMTEAFSRFVRNLAKLEGGHAPAGKRGESRR